jgi:hypothetical protein
MTCELVEMGFNVREGGGSCGELALKEGKPRMATIKCLKRTHFLIINKNLYESALQDITNRRLKEKVDFLVTQIPLFSKNLSFNFLKKFADHLEFLLFG